MKNMSSNLGSYTMLQTLGKGTFGKVKLGIVTENKSKVAIKILEKSKIVDKDDIQRVFRELKILKNFNHPNVIKISNISEDDKNYYIIMEYCEGGELFNYIVDKGRLSEQVSAEFFYQLINGVEHIHLHNVAHRDLKPENILLGKDNNIKIIDFGLSNFYSKNHGASLATPCGSPCYASPEMVSGNTYDGHKIDIWSCGIILYAMVCGHLPFEDQENDKLFEKILKSEVVFPKNLSNIVKEIIIRILETDPLKRITITDIKKHPFYLYGKSIYEDKTSKTTLETESKYTNTIETPRSVNSKRPQRKNISNVIPSSLKFLQDFKSNFSMSISFPKKQIHDEIYEHLKTDVSDQRRKITSPFKSTNFNKKYFNDLKGLLQTTSINYNTNEKIANTNKKITSSPLKKNIPSVKQISNFSNIYTKLNYKSARTNQNSINNYTSSINPTKTTNFVSKIDYSKNIVFSNNFIKKPLIKQIPFKKTSNLIKDENNFYCITDSNETTKNSNKVFSSTLYGYQGLKNKTHAIEIKIPERKFKKIDVSRLLSKINEI